MEIDEHLSLIGDKVQLQQVLLNLLLNAFDAVRDRPCGERLVAMRAQRVAGGMIQVGVADNGTGRSADRLDKIFMPFFTSKRDGLGLGLAISRSIVEAHGGQLRGTNNHDRGATFYFVLPERDSTETAQV
jgi:C4-dicarboxylate-specific signal transduction histidine kinase